MTTFIVRKTWKLVPAHDRFLNIHGRPFRESYRGHLRCLEHWAINAALDRSVSLQIALRVLLWTPFAMPANRLDTIRQQSCNARGCSRLGRGRYCTHHRSLYRYYGAPVAGPQKQLLVVHERYLRKTLGPIHETDEQVRQLMSQVATIAFEPRPIHFKDARGKTRQASYEAASGQVLRIRWCHPEETNEQLAVRLWWAFMAVQYVEMKEVYVHKDRHHFWTSVVRLLLTDGHRQKPSSRYAEYLNDRLNKLLSNPAAQWCAKVEL